MNVASLELCKELYGLSGWDSEYLQEYCQSGSKRAVYGADSGVGWYAYDKESAELHHKNAYPRYPAYDLGYLLRKLPHSIPDYFGIDGHIDLYWYEGKWWCDYGTKTHGKADTPDDATAMLAIELFEQGILTK